MTIDEGRLATIEAHVSTIQRDIAEVKESIKTILNGCPTCRAEVATHTEAIKNLRNQLAELKSDTDKQITELWSRVWIIAGGGGVGGGGLIALIAWLISRGGG